MQTFGARVAHRIEVRGTVQGVGFRPFVCRLGSGLGLDGCVRNDGGVVVIEAAGSFEAMHALAARLRTDAPAQARVSGVRVSELNGSAPAPGTGFQVVSVDLAAPGGHRGGGQPDTP